MKIEVNGDQYDGFLEASAKIFLDALTSTFSFRTTSKEAGALPFVGGEECKIIVAGKKIITGFIEIVEVEGSSTTHNIGISGRDRTADFLDSMIGTLSDIRAPITLKRLIQRIIRHIGTDIEVIDLVRPRAFNTVEDITAPEPGQDVWDYVETYARKRQVLLSSDPDGNILITQASAIHSGVTLQHKVNDDSNNVLQYSVSYDDTARFNKYQISSQLSPLAELQAKLGNAQIVTQGARSFDSAIRKGRQFVAVGETASSDAEQQKRVSWERNVRKARGRVYSATVHGYLTDNGNLWNINELVFVDDEFAGIKADMLINTVQFSISPDSGRETVLTMVEKDSYTIAIAEPVAIANTGLGLFPGLPKLDSD